MAFEKDATQLLNTSLSCMLFYSLPEQGAWLVKHEDFNNKCLVKY